MAVASTRSDRWLDLAYRLSWMAYVGSTGPYARKAHAQEFFSVADDVDTALQGRPGGWDEEFSAAIARDRFRVGTGPGGGTRHKAGGAPYLALKALRLAYAVAYDAPGLLGRHDLASLARVLTTMPGHEEDAARMAGYVAARRTAPSAAVGPITFVVAYAATGHGFAPARRAEGKVAPVRLDPEDAAVSVVMRTPAGGMPIRKYGDGYLRPLLSPGSWEPLRVEDLEEALSGESCWADDPMADSSVYTPPTALMACADDPRRRDQGDEAGRAVADALGRAGTLYVVDGVVHRVTERPKLVLLGSGDASGPLSEQSFTLGWSTGDLASSDDQGIGVPVSDPEASWPAWRGLMLPLLGPDVCEDLVAAWEEECGLDLSAARAAAPVEWLDPSAYGDDGLDALAAYVADLDPRHGDNRATQAAIEACVAAAEAGEPPPPRAAAGTREVRDALVVATCRTLAAIRAEAVASHGMASFSP